MITPAEALAGTVNVSEPLPNLVTSGQPTAAQFAALKEAGVEVVLDIRDPSESRPFDERALLAQLGIEYLNIPVTARTLNDATLEKILEALRQNSSRTMVFHCASANRVGAALIPHLILDHGMTEEEATEAALKVGLRGAEGYRWAVDYARRAKSNP